MGSGRYLNIWMMIVFALLQLLVFIGGVDEEAVVDEKRIQLDIIGYLSPNFRGFCVIFCDGVSCDFGVYEIFWFIGDLVRENRLL